jgi:RNA polymerase sigma-70 factor (family 1)
MQHKDDAEILHLFADDKTKQHAFELLVKKYQKKIYWHIRRMVLNHDDADDIVQDVFVKIWKNLHNFRQESQLYSWIYRIASNECITFLNRQKQKRNIPLDDVSAYLSENLTAASYFNGDKIQRQLQEALLTLPDKQRLVFNMKYFDDLKYEEISAIVGTSVGALKASYHLAVKKIENYLNEKE